MKPSTDIITMKEEDDFITSYNKFMMEKMHYLETTIETIQTLMEYHNYTIETIMGQIDEMKDLIVKIEEEQNKQRLEKEKEEEEKENNESEDTQNTAKDENNNKINNIDDITDEDNEFDEYKPEGSTSFFDEIYNSEEANVILDEYDNNTDFLRICKTVDFLIQDAYTAIMYIPTSNVPLTSSMAYYTTKFRSN